MNKLVIKGARVLWNHYEIVVEELPVKGAHKARLRRFTMNTNYAVTIMHRDNYLIDNILLDVKLVAEDTYEAAVYRLENEVAITHMKPGNAPVGAIHGVSVHTSSCHFLEVQPEGADKKEITCADFILKVEWTEFSGYSPRSDFNQATPYYTRIESKSKTAARRFYKLTQDEEFATKLAKTTWDNLPGVLQEYGVAYEYHHSQWT